MSGLNDAHRRIVLTTFRHLDELLATAVRILHESDAASPFAQQRADATPMQAEVLAASAVAVREAMRRTLERWSIAVAPPTASAVWSARIYLSSALVNLGDFRPRTLRGYGSLSDEAATEIRSAAAELRALIERMDRYLAQGSGGDLAARLARLEGSLDETPLLRRLEQVVRERGLVELRPALARLLERLESPALEIAFFGRVSCGKSSLLNCFLGQAVMPVGVTPVTAVPVRTCHGARACAVVHFAGHPPAPVPLAELPAYASEEGNPGNEKLVTRVEVTLPAPRLAPGVALVDTPGLGSLATAGAAATHAYLPRCDIGVVLVDAGSTFGGEELATLEGLLAAGARPVVLLSKADLVAPREVERLVAYVRDSARRRLALDLAVTPVSVRDAGALAERWFAEELLPLQRRRAEQEVAARRRKVGSLRESVVDALRGRLRGGTTSGGNPPPPAAVAELPGRAARRCEEAAAAVREIAVALTAKAASPLQRAVAGLAASGGPTPGLSARDLLGEVAAALAGEHASEVASALAELRGDLERLLAAAGAREALAERLPAPAGAPAFDGLASAGSLEVAALPFAFLGRRHRERWLRRELGAVAGPRLARAFEVYRRLLEDWGRRAVRELQHAFEAELALVAVAPAGGDATRSDADTAALASEIDELERWPATVAGGGP